MLIRVGVRCKIAECDDFNEPSNWIRNAIPTDAKKCEMYDRVDDYNRRFFDSQNCSADTFNTSSIVKCNEFVFKTQQVNILNEFNLTCEENRWKLTFVGSIGNVAECITLPFIGILADR